MTNTPSNSASRRTYSNDTPLERGETPSTPSILLTYISRAPSAASAPAQQREIPPPPLPERNIRVLPQTRASTASFGAVISATPSFGGSALNSADTGIAGDDSDLTALLDRLEARHTRTLGCISNLLRRAAEHSIYAYDVRQAATVAQALRTTASASYFTRIKRNMHLDRATGAAWGNPGTRQDMLNYLIQTSIEDAKAEFLLMEVKAAEELINEQIGQECETALEIQRQFHEAESIVELILAPDTEVHTPQVHPEPEDMTSNAPPPSKRPRRDDV